MLRKFHGKGGPYAVSTNYCKSYGLLGRSAVISAAADGACACTADITDLVYVLFLHKKSRRAEIMLAHCTQ